VQAPASAIAHFILESGGASSSEILLRFMLSESTLRRRRPAIRRYGIVFVECGSGSHYVPAELAQLPEHHLPTAVQTGATPGHSDTQKGENDANDAREVDL
jgi:hypothetical protein